jgi:phosphatidylglycerol:prolipoprotein diacylglycerol transferase
MLAFINYPSWLHPSVFGFLDLSPGNPLMILRWYPLSYLAAFGVSYIINSYLVKENKFHGIDKKFLSDLYFYGIIGLVLGARIGYCLIYEPGYYLMHPHEILIPIRGGKFTGFQGMSFHGGVAGAVIAVLILSIKRRVAFTQVADTFVPGIPLGYTFGRLGNFANAELYGRITSHPIGMLFPNRSTQKLPVDLPQVRDTISELGWKIGEGNDAVTASGDVIQNVVESVASPSGLIQVINLPRHPSQLYESLLEGVVLFLILWFVVRKFRLFEGIMLPAFLAGYSLARFTCEFFRQPDQHFADLAAGKYTGTVIGPLTMGHMLSLIYLGAAIAIAVWFIVKPPLPAKLEKQGGHKKKRKKRK